MPIHRAKIRLWQALLICWFIGMDRALPESETPDSPKPNPNLAPILPRTVAIDAACFQMGSPEYEAGRGDNENPHRVCVKHFKIAIHETTVAEFRRFVEATGYRTDAELDYEIKGCWSFDASKNPAWNWWDWANWQHPVKDAPLNEQQPVSCVSWNDIHHYINWLNQTSHRRYRLPTEAEWEYAARANSNNSYFWGNNADLACRYANLADDSSQQNLTWPNGLACIDHFFYLAPVKQFLPNRLGLHDMLGNVWEWTCSRYAANYGTQEQICLEHGAIEPKTGESAAPSELFIAVRGGGWNTDPKRARIAYRNFDDPWARLANWGFRLVQMD